MRNVPDDSYIAAGEACRLLECSYAGLYRLDAELKPVVRQTGHRRYSLSRVRELAAKRSKP